MSQQSDPRIPILRDAVGRQSMPGAPTAADALVAELQTRLAAECFALTESTLRRAFAEMEANLLEQISTRLRQALPELIDTVLREQLEPDERLDRDPEEGSGMNDRPVRARTPAEGAGNDGLGAPAEDAGTHDSEGLK